MAKFATNGSGAMLSPSLIKVTESISGSVVPLAMFSQLNFTVSLLIAIHAAHMPELTHDLVQYVVDMQH